MDEALDLYDARDETLEFDGLERALLLCAAMNRKRDGERVPRSEDNQGDRARREDRADDHAPTDGGGLLIVSEMLLHGSGWGSCGRVWN